MKLYIHPASPNCVKVLVAADLAGLEPEVVVVDLARGEQRRPPFLALNPNGRVPAMEDDGTVLWEANAILHWIATAAPDRGLWPDDRRRQAEVIKWQSWDLAHLAPAVRPYQWERLFKPMLGLGEPDEAAIEAVRQPLLDCAAVLDAALAGRDWLVGDRITLADVSLAARLMYLEAARLPLEGFAEIARWRGRVAALPAWRRSVPQREGVA
jgi:glutathione S-transferase